MVGPTHFIDAVVEVPRTYPIDRIDEIKRRAQESVSGVLGDAGGRRRIGLVWRGNPVPAHRSASLDILQPLLALRTAGYDLQWVSLQKDLKPEEREQLILEHLPQVRLIARRIHERLPESVSIDDLISTGVVGLISAIDRFDSAHNVKLKTYAEYKIRGAILDSLRALDWVPRTVRSRSRGSGNSRWSR